MKFSTRRDVLFTQLQTVTRAASTRSAVQALSGVHVVAEGGGIDMRATDIEIGLRVPIDGDIAREGAVPAPRPAARRRRALRRSERTWRTASASGPQAAS